MYFELLYFDGCPSWHQALENLRQALAFQGEQMEVSLIQVKDHDDATKLRFQGSPTLRAAGADLFLDQVDNYGLSCRVYKTEEGLKGWPTVPMILGRLRTLQISPAIGAD